MKFLVLICALVATTSAALQGYSLQRPAGSTLSTGPGQATGSGFSVGVSSGHGQEVRGLQFWNHVEKDKFDMWTVLALHQLLTVKYIVFDVPEQKEPIGPPPSIPPPRVDHNILFVRLPEEGEGPEPIVVPPPRQENIVYVLNKKDEQAQRVIEVPAHPPSDPEIYFVNYEEGENPTLPIGVDLNTALGSAAEAGGQVIGAAGAGLGGNIGGVGGDSGFGTVSGVGGVGAGSGFGTVSGGVGGVGTGSGFGTVSGGFAGGNVGSGSSFQVGSGVSGFQTGSQINVGTSPSGLYSTP
ncbi:ATP-dependent RNA helicase A-like [Penaeus indicus]|uniref:ATP-dependent RNA helicase A-like n=1 Tax=Penaeus indicus TaxID=29960 RepID=UPI00300C3D59